MEITENIDLKLGKEQQALNKEDQKIKEEQKINHEKTLIDAILIHDEATIQTLIDNPKLNFQYDENGNNLLFYATKEGNLELVKKLLSKKFDINFRNQYGVTVLHQAAMMGRMDLVELFLKNYADIEAVCLIPKKEKQRPLECAIENGHFAVVKRLVEAGTELTKVVDYLNPFEYARKYAQLEILRFFGKLDLNATPKLNWTEEELYLCKMWQEFVYYGVRFPKPNEPFRFGDSKIMFNAALEYGHVNIANRLFRNKEHRIFQDLPHDYQREARERQERVYSEALFKTFIVCIQRNHLNSVKWILKRHPEFLNKFYGEKSERITPITFAAVQGNIEIVKFLLQQGADIAIRNADNTIFTYLKSYNGLANRQEILQLMLDTNPAACEFIADLKNSDPRDHFFIKGLLATKEYLDQDPNIIKFLAAIVELYYFDKTNDFYLEDKKILKNIIEYVAEHVAGIMIKKLNEQCVSLKPETNEPKINAAIRLLKSVPEKYRLIGTMIKNKLDFMLNRAAIHHFLPYISFALSCKAQDFRRIALPNTRLSSPIFYTINSFLGNEHSNIFGLGCSDGVLEKYKNLCPPLLTKHFGQKFTVGFYKIFSKLFNERAALVQRKFQEKFKSNVAAPKLLESSEQLQNGTQVQNRKQQSIEPPQRKQGSPSFLGSIVSTLWIFGSKKENKAGADVDTASNSIPKASTNGGQAQAANVTAPAPSTSLALVPRERSAAERFFSAVECDDEAGITATLELLSEQYSKDTLQKAVLHLFSKTCSRNVDPTALLRAMMAPEQAKARPAKKASV